MLMLLVVSPVFHVGVMYPDGAVSVAGTASQKWNGVVDASRVGSFGEMRKLWICTVQAVRFVSATQYTPDEVTAIDAVVAPVFHACVRKPAGAVSVMLVPEQRLSAVMPGRGASGLTVTWKVSIFSIHVLNTVSATQNVPPLITTMDELVAPVFQKWEANVGGAVRVSDVPSQKLTIETVGTSVGAVTVTLNVSTATVQLTRFVSVTQNNPGADVTIEEVVAPVFQTGDI
jgi:hypothetical protein